MEFVERTLHEVIQQSSIEWLAALLGVAYLVLVMRQSLWCWPCALLSTAMYTWVFWDVSLFMESALNVYYMAMAVYGFWCWKGGADAKEGAKDSAKNSTKETILPISTWSFKKHSIAITVVIGLSVMSGYFLDTSTRAALPYLDSFTTWGSVLTTYMVAKKVFENWIYWLVIDAVALFLYIDRGLYATTALMAIYLVLAVIGLFAWARQLPSAQMQPETV
ncbi:MAG: nicotinamide mononucleotide transporter [Lentisphaeria bacterium]|jgi:nicotinamide mononucleotide transporter